LCRPARNGACVMNVQDMPGSGGGVVEVAVQTYSGNRALDHEEGLIFEIGRPEVCGVDLPDIKLPPSRLAGMERTEPIGLPGLSEPEAVRHYVRLSQRNAAIDTSLYPLGSCTMKHKPRPGETLARLAGFGDIHSLQPPKTVPCRIAPTAWLGNWAKHLAGLPAGW